MSLYMSRLAQTQLAQPRKIAHGRVAARIALSLDLRVQRRVPLALGPPGIDRQRLPERLFKRTELVGSRTPPVFGLLITLRSQPLGYRVARQICPSLSPSHWLIRLILPNMSMVITPITPLLKKQQNRLNTWLTFTSAMPSKVAQFPVGGNRKNGQADNGTLFFDEVGDMPADVQVKLLLVL